MSKANQARALVETAEISAGAAQVVAGVTSRLRLLGVPSELLTELGIAEKVMNLTSVRTKENTVGLAGTDTSYASKRLLTARVHSEVSEAAGDKKKMKALADNPSLVHIKNALAKDAALRSES